MRSPLHLLLCVCAGCFTRPDLLPAGDAGNGSLAGVMVVGDGFFDPLTIIGPGYELGFPKPFTYRPDRLIVGGQNVIGGVPGCAVTDGVGVTIHPVFSTNDPSLSLQVVVAEVGPAAVEVRISWDGIIACPTMTSGDKDPSGFLVISAYPDGRIIRRDSVTSTDDAFGPTTDACGCEPNPTNQFYVSTFLTVRDDRFTRAVYQATTTPVEQPLPLPGEVDAPNPAWACVDHASEGRRVGVVWSNVSTMFDGGTRFRPEPAASSTTFLYDIVYAEPQVDEVEHTVSSAWFVDSNPAASCDAMATLAQGYENPRMIEITTAAEGTQVGFLDPGSGAYGWISPPGVTSYTIEAPGIVGLPSGTAIAINFPTDTPPTVTLGQTSLVAGRDYLQQSSDRADDFLHTFWFAAPIPNETPLVIAQE